MKGKAQIGTLMVGIAALSFIPLTYADEGQPRLMIQDLQRQITEMGKTIEAQNQMIAQLNARILDLEGKGMEVRPVRVAGEKAITETSHPWLKDLKFSGDLRLRYEAIDFTPGETIKGVRDRNRFRYQLRFGLTKKLFDDLKLGFWLASGDTAAPTSTNATLDTDFAKKLIWIERVYLTYTPDYLEGLEITAGKFKNPLVTSDILWDSDVRPEGIYEKYSRALFGGAVKPFVTLGQWILQEDSVGAPGDAELFVYQGGLTWKVKEDFMRGKPLEVKFASTFYDFTDYGDAFVTAGGNPTQANGNLAVEDFNIGDLYLEAKLTPFAIAGRDIPLKFFMHLANNFANEAIVTATTAEEEDQAYSYGFQIGDLKKQGDWRLKGRYSYIAPNAVAGGLADADFGGANRRGIEFAFAYLLRDNLKFEFTGNLSGNVTGVDTEQRMFHTDLSMKF